MSGPLVIGNYHIIKLLGKGSFGRVYLARDTQNQEVALKIINPAYAIQKATLIQKEFQLAQEIHEACPNTVAYLESFPIRLPNSLVLPEKWRGKGTRVLVMEYLSGNSMIDSVYNLFLNKGLRSDPSQISEPSKEFLLDPLQILEFLDQLSLIVECIHQHNLVHGDINLGNVFFDGSKYLLIDFGGSCRLFDPERMEESKENKAEICEILNINTPFLNMLPELAKNQISDREYYSKYPIPVNRASQYYLANDVYSVIICGIECMLPQILNDPDLQNELIARPFSLPEKLITYSIEFVNSEMEQLAQELVNFIIRAFYGFHKGIYLTITEFREGIQKLTDFAAESFQDYP